jgi:hypothetical protein
MLRRALIAGLGLRIVFALLAYEVSVNFQTPQFNLELDGRGPARRAAMLSPQVYAALFGAVVAGLFAVLAGLITHRKAIERFKAEADQRNQEWQREKLHDAYSNAIYYAFKAMLSTGSSEIGDKDVRQQVSETQRYLTLLGGYHRSEDATRLLQCAKSLRIEAIKNARNIDQRQVASALWDALNLSRELLAADSRIVSPPPNSIDAPEGRHAVR